MNQTTKNIWAQALSKLKGPLVISLLILFLASLMITTPSVVFGLATLAYFIVLVVTVAPQGITREELAVLILGLVLVIIVGVLFI